MVDKNWKVMQDLDASFSNITTISFLSDKLIEAADRNDQQSTVDIAHALLAFLPVYTQDFDEKFQKAWSQFIK